MMLKRTFLAVFAIVAVQSHNIYRNEKNPEADSSSFKVQLPYIEEQNEEPAYRRIFVNVLRALSKVFPAPDKELLELKTLVDAAIKNATNNLENLTYELAKEAQTIILQANSTLQIESRSLLEEISALEAECEALRIDAKHCIQGQNPSLSSLPSLFRDKLSACEGDKVAQGDSLIRRAQEKVQYALDNVEHYSEDLKLCDKQEGVRVKLCRAQIALKIVDEKKRIPGGIDKVVQDTIGLISSVYSEVQICTVNVNTDFLNQGKHITDTIEKCIDQEIIFKLAAFENEA